jgi:hypothetical protein
MNISIQIGGVEAILILLVLLLVIAGIVFWFLRYKRKVDDFISPKFGFLGKPLTYVLVIAMFGILGSVGLSTYLSSTSSVDDRTNADTLEKVDIVYTKIENTKTGVRVNLSAVIRNIKEKKYDISWTIDSDKYKDLALFEADFTKDNPSNLVVILKEGTYQVNATVVSGDLTIKKYLEIEVK